MPLRDYKAQYSVIIYRYISFGFKKVLLEWIGSYRGIQCRGFSPDASEKLFFSFYFILYQKYVFEKWMNGWWNTRNKTEVFLEDTLEAQIWSYFQKKRKREKKTIVPKFFQTLFHVEFIFVKEKHDFK